MTTKRKGPPPTPPYHRVTYMTDLARGGSHIASAISAPSQHAAIADVIMEFRERHTTGNVPIFLELLEEELLRRGALAAAALVKAMR